MARYEGLRRAALDGAWSTSGAWGLTLFMCQGLVAWMHACPQQAQDEPLDPRHAPAPTAPPGVPTPLSAPLVTILANMVFTARQEVLV